MKIRWVLSATAVLLGSLSAIAQPTDEIKNWAAPPYWMPQQAATRGSGETGGREALASGSQALVTTASSPMPFVAVTPCRVADTRDSSLNVGAFLNGTPSMQARVTRAFFIKGSCGIPANAQAVSLNATVAYQSASRLARPLARAARPGPEHRP